MSEQTSSIAFDFPETITRRELVDEASRVASEESDAALRFSLLLPSHLARTKASVVRAQTHGFESVVFTWASSDGASSVVVHVDHLKREVSPAAWARRRAATAGYTVHHERKKHTPIGELADILSTKDGRVARTNMAKDGEHLYTIVCETRESEWNALAEAFLVTLSSWKLVDPTRTPFSEPLESFAAIAPIIAGFLHPASYALTSERASETEQTVTLDVRDSERLQILFRKHPDSDETPARSARAFYTAWRSDPANLDHPSLEAASPEIVTTRDDLLTPIGGRSRGTRFGAPAEHRFQILATRGAMALVTASSPRYVDDPLGWAATERAFELACESLYLVS